MTIKIEIKGIEETKEKLKDIAAEKLQKTEDAIKQAGFHIQSEVQASIAGQRAEPESVDTGRFLNSVKTTFPEKYSASVETNVEYAKFLEYGTSKMAPRHHFTNTVMREEDKVKNYIRDAIK
jgi:HK97 gp10 family phage protein